MARLWPHQAAAGAACRELSGGGRATVVAACGAGKTLTGAEVSRRVAPSGRVLVVVPTLDLLAQTARAWAGWLGAGAGRVIGVCSDPAATDDARAEMTGLHARVTADPVALAGELAAGGRVTVLSTYASLPVIAAAHGSHGAPRWDLVLADEAHRCAGRRGGPWGIIHYDEQVPAARRLYMTATPRIMPGAGEQAVSMDDRGIFGPVVHRLSFARAIGLGLLADYRVLVAVVTDAEAAKVTAGHVMSVAGVELPAREAAAQVALARAIRRHDLRRVITYHRRVASAGRLAATLPATVEAMGPGSRPQRRVTAGHVSGAMARDRRRAQLAMLADPGEGTAVVANARVLAEGIDVPALDAVMFADPKDSVIDTVQAVGRALRRGPGAGKTATIIVPVLAEEGQDPRAALETSEFETVWQVVRALRAHDERIAGRLDQARARLGRPAREGGGGEAGGEARGWLEVAGSPVTAAFAAAIQVRTIETATSSWPQWHAALAGYRDEHGHASVPQGYRTGGGLALGTWLAGQRKLRAAGQLPAGRAAALEALGVTWKPQEQAWAEGLAAAAAWHAGHGSLDVPSRHVTAGGFRLGSWIGERRREQRKGTLAPARAADLERLGIRWDTAFDAAWQQGLDRLAAWRAARGHARVPASHADPDGYRLGSWLAVQRTARRRGELPPGRVAALDELGVVWEAEDTSFEDGLARLARFAGQHGHARVPAKWADPGDGYRLGSWVSSLRARRRRPGAGRRRPLSDGEIAALDRLGMIWDATGTRGETRPATPPHQAAGTSEGEADEITA